MAMYGSTWREHPFLIGKRYVAKTDLPSFNTIDIKAGHIYELREICHSHYDGASVFTFQCIKTDKLANWWWFDSEPDNLCLDHFKEST
ncbi:hypothetical protein, partial [Microbulbifer litoralis]|uniref:hypothetical protein n=1 Tax=Microbulbifer litoralis TaxID=2933965 RepID=UPI0020293277